MEWENVVAGQRADPAQINKIGNQVAKYKGLRLARRIVLTEVVATIEFNTDSDGNALNSTLGGELLFYSGTNASITSSATCYARINNVGQNDSYWVYSGTSNTFVIGFVGNAFSKNHTDINILNQNLTIGSDYTYKSTASGNTASYGGGMTAPQSSITAIKLFLSAGTFPAGTVVEWWERG